jgi:hypothetical protein
MQETFFISFWTSSCPYHQSSIRRSEFFADRPQSSVWQNRRSSTFKGCRDSSTEAKPDPFIQPNFVQKPRNQASSALDSDGDIDAELHLNRRNSQFREFETNIVEVLWNPISCQWNICLYSIFPWISQQIESWRECPLLTNYLPSKSHRSFNSICQCAFWMNWDTHTKNNRYKTCWISSDQ